MAEERRLRPLVKILGGAFLFVGLALLWTRIHSLAEQRWAAMEARAGEIAAAARARDPKRPVLRGEAVPGNAWDDYREALDALGRIRGFWAASPTYSIEAILRQGSQKERVDAFHKSFEEHGLLLEYLRKGARRDEAQYPYDWEAGYQYDDNVGGGRLVQLARIGAWRDRREGRPLEAAELLLDACQFSRDIGFNGELDVLDHSCFLLREALNGLEDLVVSGELDREGLAQVARELGVLDGSMPPVEHSILNYPAFLWREVGRDIASPARPGHSGFYSLRQGRADVVGFWALRRWGFSTRLMVADVVEKMDRGARRAAGIAGRPWAEVSAEVPVIAGECGEEGQPFVHLFSGIMESGRDVRSRLRLLRAAVHYLAEGQVPSLDDPFGAKLLHEESDGKLRIWSVGPRRGEDIVLKVIR